MRFIVKAKLDTAIANEAARKGKLGSTLQSILDDLKPEAVYFIEENGYRTAVLVIDMADTSQLPAIAEPFFLAFNAAVTFHPAMVPEDFEKSGAAIGAAVQKYG